MTKLWSDHYWYFTQKGLFGWIVFYNSEFRFSFLPFSKASFFHGFLNEFLKSNIYIYFCCISQVSDSRFMRKHWLITFICFLDSWWIINMHLFKDDIIIDIVFLSLSSRKILRFYLDSILFMLLDNFLNIHFQESIERRNLLWDKTMLLKISTNNSPSIILINLISVGIKFPILKRWLVFFRVQHF